MTSPFWGNVRGIHSMVSPVTAPHSLTVAVAAHDMNGQAHVGRKRLRLKHIQYNIYIYIKHRAETLS